MRVLYFTWLSGLESLGFFWSCGDECRRDLHLHLYVRVANHTQIFNWLHRCDQGPVSIWRPFFRYVDYRVKDKMVVTRNADAYHTFRVISVRYKAEPDRLPLSLPALCLYGDSGQINGIAGILKLRKWFEMSQTSLPLFASPDNRINPHLASQYHTWPSVARGIAMLLLGNFRQKSDLWYQAASHWNHQDQKVVQFRINYSCILCL